MEPKIATLFWNVMEVKAKKICLADVFELQPHRPILEKAVNAHPMEDKDGAFSKGCLTLTIRNTDVFPTLFGPRPMVIFECIF